MKNLWFSFSQHATDSKSTPIHDKKTINVLGYIGGNSSALTSKMQSALQVAIKDCNDLHSDFNFQLTYGSNYHHTDVVVYRASNDLPGAKVAVPEGDRTNKWIQINSGIDYLESKVIEDVMSREIRYALGLKKKEGFWQLRKESPPVYDGGVAISNYDSEEDAEFDFYDRVVREYLY